ncbi:uncharacterized protein LOC143228153 isoform X2 [Tachypleus tridentatus]|uniref:uncharacterized protein LOC143228153 isoform X2 n=1 Tax=Tachypleus tridentatus TaxID=6853 RepID=UPI003FD50FEE
MFTLLLLGIICFATGLTLCSLLLLLFKSKASTVTADESQAIEMYKLVEALREVCPVGSSSGWVLFRVSSMLRCWKRDFSFKFLGSEVEIYGSSVLLNTSAVAILNVIADVSTWPEWEPTAQQRPLQAELSDDTNLHGDQYMQCDQVLTSRSGNSLQKPGILMHRFGNLEKNGVGWILLWHVMQLDWCFFLAQPVETNSTGAPNQCQLTAINTISPYVKTSENPAVMVTWRLQNLKEALTFTNVKLKPFQSLKSSLSESSVPPPHVPMIRSALIDITHEPNELLKPQEVKSKSNTSQEPLLAVVPFAMSKPITLKNVKGFVLVTRVQKSNSKNSSNGSSFKSGDKVRIRRRARNQSGCLPAFPNSQTREVSKQSNIPVVVSDVNDLRLIGGKSDVPSETGNKENISMSVGQALFNTLFFKRRKSSSSTVHLAAVASATVASAAVASEVIAARDGGRTSSDECVCEKKNLSALKSLNQQLTDTQGSTYCGDGNLSDSAGLEIILPNVSSKDKNIDYKAIGSCCVSEVLKQITEASNVNFDNSPEEQRKGSVSWVFEGTHKDVVVLMKWNTDSAIKTVSYLCKGQINVSPNTVWKTIKNPLTRFMYDETTKKVNVLQEFPNSQKIIHIYHESISLLKKEAQDFCLLQTEGKEGTYLVLALQSVDYFHCPLMKDVTREMILPSGWVIEPLSDENKSMVAYLFQLIVSSQDSMFVEDMGNILPQCISNLRTYLATEPP